MRKIFTFLTIFSLSFGFAIDRYVDPNLSSSNGTTFFNTITAAVTAAQNGDRIIIVSSTYNEAALTIGKSLQIMPQTPGTTINFNANITIAGFPGMKLEITGFNLGVYSMSNSSAGTVVNRAKITVIDCAVSNMDFNREGFEINAIRNTVSGQLIFTYGNIILNTIGTLYFLDESRNSPLSNEKVSIIANTINNMLYVYNNDYKFTIANNTISGAFILKRWNANSTLKNKILNNKFNNPKFLISAFNVPQYNLSFFNNLGDINLYIKNDPNTSPRWELMHLDYNSQNAEDVLLYYNNYTDGNVIKDTLFPNNDVSGSFEWSYNGFQLRHPSPAGSQPLSFTNIAGSTDITDAGNPNHEYYDIDLTVNDRGVNGGPYSVLNYNAANPNNSKAFIFDLDMPADLFPGQNVEIKAKGYHKN